VSNEEKPASDETPQQPRRNFEIVRDSRNNPMFRTMPDSRVDVVVKRLDNDAVVALEAARLSHVDGRTAVVGLAPMQSGPPLLSILVTDSVSRHGRPYVVGIEELVALVMDLDTGRHQTLRVPPKPSLLT
jgi:hypothetical protein